MRHIYLVTYDIRDDKRLLYLNTQRLFVGKSDELLQIQRDGKLLQEVRLREIDQVNLFGNIQISTQALQTQGTRPIGRYTGRHEHYVMMSLITLP